MRHHSILKTFDPQPGVIVSTLAHEYPAGFRVPEHAHGSDQLIFATRGLMEVISAQSVWLVPPQFALWVPAKTRHRISMQGAVSMRTLYMRPKLKVRPASACAVLHVAPLLRELILEAVRIGNLRGRNEGERALTELIVMHVRNASPIPTFVMMPSEERAQNVAKAVLAEPGRYVPMAGLCASAGASVRTVQRTFRREMGIDFDSWRRQVRLTKAVESLVSGLSVKEVAFAAGYRQPSAFVECFRKTFGLPPKAWVTSLGRLNPGIKSESR